ncbi:MAG: adenosylcobinamide-phosphate synthase CbiB [Deferrisomatales bacterium]
MTFTPLDLAVAWSLDAALGDPRGLPWPHPVVAIGRAVARLETPLRRGARSPGALMARGALLWVLVVGGTGAAGWLVLAACTWVHPWAGRAAAVYLAYACLATRSLDREARKVARLLARGHLERARRHLAGIVGRDTENLPAREVARAAVETVAENCSDGVVAPLFYLCLGAWLGWGPLGALAYKAVNTLDSMVGYRDDRYEHFGKASALLDDAFNWIPARLTALLAAGAAQLLWGRGTPAWRVAWRDARTHKSPNAGFPEAAFAGALDVTLGGPNTYRGVVRASPRIGDGDRPLDAPCAADSLRLLWAVSGGAAALGIAALWLAG